MRKICLQARLVEACYCSIGSVHHTTWFLKVCIGVHSETALSGGKNSRFDLESDITRLEETHDLICGCHSCIVVGLQSLSTHLLLREDDALAHFVADRLRHVCRCPC